MKRHAGKLIALLVGLLLWGLAVLVQLEESPTDVQGWVRVLSNGALIPGVLYLGLSALSWIAGDGLFDGIKYATSCLWIHLKGEQKRYATYYDYIHRPKKERTGSAMLWPGVFYLLCALVLTGIFYLL
jgi:hypothetical protein